MNKVVMTFIIIEFAVLTAYYFLIQSFLLKWFSKNKFLLYVVVVIGAYFITKFTWLGTNYFVGKV